MPSRRSPIVLVVGLALTTIALPRAAGGQASLSVASPDGRNVLAIELLCAAQGIDLRRPLTTTKPLEAVHAAIRSKVPAMMEDRPIAPDIAAVRALIDDGSLLAAARGAGAA